MSDEHGFPALSSKNAKRGTPGERIFVYRHVASYTKNVSAVIGTVIMAGDRLRH